MLLIDCKLHYKVGVTQVTQTTPDVGVGKQRKCPPRLHRTYQTWCSIKQRCLNRRNSGYAYYGGRGITICEGFMRSDNFLSIVGVRPKNRSLDRIDNNGGYWCGQCNECISKGQKFNIRWATRKQQRINQRSRQAYNKHQVQAEKAMANKSARGGTLTTIANAEKLKRLRGDRKQKEIERGASISRGQLTRFETGKPVGVKYLLQLANFYHVPALELLSEEGLRTSRELLTDLASLLGVKIDFSSNGSEHVPPATVSGTSEHAAL